MLIAKITGNVVGSHKLAAFSGSKLLLAEICSVASGPKPEIKLSGRTMVTVDTVGAGEGEYVLLTQGSSARLTEMTNDMPVDAVIVGIVDAIQVGDQVFAGTNVGNG
jgi:ethanolamine utilization protein EutN